MVKKWRVKGPQIYVAKNESLGIVVKICYMNLGVPQPPTFSPPNVPFRSYKHACMVISSVQFYFFGPFWLKSEGFTTKVPPLGPRPMPMYDSRPGPGPICQYGSPEQPLLKAFCSKVIWLAPRGRPSSGSPRLSPWTGRCCRRTSRTGSNM